MGIVCDFQSLMMTPKQNTSRLYFSDCRLSMMTIEFWIRNSPYKNSARLRQEITTANKNNI